MQYPTVPHGERLGWLIDSWSSVELRVRIDFALEGDAATQPLDYDRSVEHYVETARGERLSDTLCSNSGIPTYRSAHYFDGRTGTSILFDKQHLSQQTQVFLQRHYNAEDRSGVPLRPYPLATYWAGREPLHESLPRAEHLGPAKAMDRPCDRYRFSGVGPKQRLDQVVYLDQETSAPLRVESFLRLGDRAKDQPVMIWEAKKLDTIQGYPIATESILRTQRLGEGKYGQRQEISVESIAFNKSYAESTFRPALQPGAVVFDTITNKPHYRVPGKEQPPKAEATPAKAIAVAAPLVAHPPRAWELDAASTSIGLGALVLVAAAVLWWRRG